ncbi:MAG TPA: alginate export family protein [Caulifigura sp.]|nr:alginate export family protein [Caulifigura sp.]
MDALKSILWGVVALGAAGIASAQEPAVPSDAGVAVQQPVAESSAPATGDPAERTPVDGKPVDTAAPAKKPAPKKAPPKKTPPVFPGAKVLPPTGPYKPLFFDNDFSAVGKPGDPYLLGEELKNMKFEMFDTDFVFSTGGELRHRFLSQDNRLQPGGPGHSDYQQWRWRHYIDLKAGDSFRVYVEGIDASTFGEDLPVHQIDENRWDLLNAFVDVHLFDTDTGTHTLRYGRQELLFGRQRLVSPLDWANIRRNFEGVRYMVKEKDWKLDVFAVNPVNSATGYQTIAEFNDKFDEANRNVWFSGAYWTMTSIPDATWDVYWLWLNNTEPVPGRADGRRHTIGSRYAWLNKVDDSRVWDFDVEGAYQFGDDDGERVNAGFLTGVAGHTWKKAPWTPRVSGLAYYGSGDVDRSDGQTNTFDVMFPLGHAYWGILDNFSGQNLVDLSAQVDVKPTDKTALVAAYHWMQLANNNDTAYNVAGGPVGTPNNGVDLGDELDLYGYYAFNPNFDIQAGYSRFWYGSFIENTTPRGDANQFYIMTSVRY